MRMIKRIFKNLSAGRWQVARSFPKHSMQKLEGAIRQSESLHSGELRFAVEAGLEWSHLWAGMSSRERAVEVFSQLRVWDTEHNSGVLIYLLLAERKVEIVADRGIHARVGNERWKVVCNNMESKFRSGEFESGVLEGINAITQLLQQNFPTKGIKSNELPDFPVML